MKTAKWITASVAFLLVLLTPAFSQVSTMRASVPFEFTVGNQKLAPGEYHITLNGPSAGPAMLRLARTDGRDVAGILTSYIRSDKVLPARLVFHRYGSHYFLAEAWMGEVSLGHQVFVSGEELEYARNLKQEQTTVMAQN